jgi:hypothetical protein
MPDAHVGANSGPVSAKVLAIGAAVNADVMGETRMAPAKQPAKMRDAANELVNCYELSVIGKRARRQYP